MRVELKMPKAGEEMTTGTIAKWLKAPGDAVERGEPIAEVETDKVAIELEAIATGTLSEIICESGVEVEVGRTIAYIETP